MKVCWQPETFNLDDIGVGVRKSGGQYTYSLSGISCPPLFRFIGGTSYCPPISDFFESIGARLFVSWPGLNKMTRTQTLTG